MVSHALDLIYNLALLVALCVVSRFLPSDPKRSRWGVASQGLLFGLGALIAMNRPIAYSPGIIFDGRSVMVSLCGLFFGPLAGLFAGTMAAAYRIQLGGGGATTGVLVIAASALWGGLLHHRWTLREVPLTAGRLLGFGLLVHLSMVLLMATLPGGRGWPVIRTLGLPILIAYPTVTLLAGTILADQTRIRRYLASLREEKTQHQALLSAIPDLMFLIRADGTFLAAHAGRPELLFAPPSGFLGRTVPAVLPPEPAQRIMSAVAGALAGGSLQEIRYELAVDGRSSFFEARVVPHSEDTVVAIVRDLTAAHAAERLRQEAEARLALAMEATRDGIWDWDIATGHVTFNSAYAEMLGFQPEELRQELATWSERIHPDDRARVLAVNQACIDGPEASFEVEYRLRTKDGAWKWILGRGRAVTRDAEGRALRLVGTHMDLTERKQAEAALASSEERLRSFVEGSQDWIWATDAAGVHTFSNPAVQTILGYLPEEVIGQPAERLLHPEDCPRAVEVLQAHAREKRGWSGVTLRWRHRDGSIRHLESRSMPILGPDGTLLGFQGTDRDLTQRVQAEEEFHRLQAQLHQSQKMESLGSLAGGVAHDMNNVLGAILGLASASLEASSADSPHRRAFETILKAAERGGKMVRGLLSLARPHLTDPRALDLNELIREEANLLEHTTLARVRLELDLDPGLPLVHGDGGALTHALMNLCVNAVDAMPAGGTLTLRTRRAEDGGAEVLVADTGTGMPEAVLQKALDPFFTTKEPGKGTGLGLALVFSTVKAHGGTLLLESQPGQGTRATLRFPGVERAATLAAPSEAAQGAPHRPSLRVLVVDDDPLIQSSMEAILEGLGHQVTLAPCGEEALAHLERGLSPQVIVLDMNMPGLGGQGTLPRLRALLPDTPVLLSTGRADQEARDLMASFPAVRLLAKPFTMAELRRQLDDVVP